MNGQSRYASSVQIEGLDNNQRTGLLTILIPPAEAIDTVSVTTSNYDAEFGRAAGAVTNVTLKSGTNTTKGSAFWFGNTDATNALPASTYFSSTVRTKHHTSYNQFGFTVGGPIKKNKLFYFGDYQRTQDRLGTSYLFVVPTEAFRRGDFSAAPTKVYDPRTGDSAGAGRTQFANNQIPQDRINPIALALISKIPPPNRTKVALGVGNYQVDSYRDKNTNSFDGKVNYAVSQSNQVSLRFSYQKPKITQLPANGYADWGGPLGGGFIATGTNSTYSTGGELDPHLLEHVRHGGRGGVSYYHNDGPPHGQGKNLATQVGIKGVNLDDWTSGPTTINIGQGFSNPVLGYVNSLPWDRYERTWEFASTLTKLRGNHTIKFGADWRHNSDMLLQTQDNQGPRGGTPSGPRRVRRPTRPRKRHRERVRVVPARPAERHRARPEGASTRSARKALGASSASSTTSGRRRPRYDRPRAAVGVPRSDSSASAGKGSLSNYDPTSNSLPCHGYGRYHRRPRRQEGLQQLEPAARACRTASTTRPSSARATARARRRSRTTGTRSTTRSSRTTASRRRTLTRRRRSMATGFPAPTYLHDPENGIVNADLATAAPSFCTPGDLQQGTLYTWNVAFQRELIWGLTGEVAWVGNIAATTC